MKRCAQCDGKLGLGVRSRNLWNGRWWVDVRFCSSRCAALYELKQQDTNARRWRTVAMADGTLDSQVGARICNGLGIMRACLETQKLEQLEPRMDEIADRVARDRTNAAHKEYTHEDARSH